MNDDRRAWSIVVRKLSAETIPTILAVLLIVAPVRVSAWDNITTHPEITDAARARFQDFDEILENQYGLTDGQATALAVQRGFGSIDLQLDVNSGRFERRLGSANDDPPTNVSVTVNAQCSLGPEFETCFENLERNTISKLLRVGAYGEDAPSVRARHHFHDPVRTHGNPTTTVPPGFPTDNRGQDNTRIISPFSFDEFIANLATRFLFGGGGDFRLFGRSARDRALNIGFAGTAEPRNFFDLPDAERYLYRAFTATTKDEREHFMALHFLAVGSVLHLLEDMSSVAHTRNDFVVDHGRRRRENLEVAGGSVSAIRLIRFLAESGGELLLSTPAAELAKFAPERFAAQFDMNLPDVDTTAFDADEFWQRPAGVASPEQLGLAEFVNPRFFSVGTTSNTHVELGYPFPLVPPCEEGAEVGSGDERVAVVRLPARTLAEGTIHRPNVERLFLSSSLVPHLATCSFHGIGRNGAQRLRMAPWAYSVIDESVQRDYLELLLPLGIDYTQKFLQFYFQPRIDVVPTGNNEFDLINRSTKLFTASTDELKIYYDDVDGFRQSVVIECNTAGDSEFTLAPDAHLECEMPTLLPGGLSAPRSRGDFSVVIRGQLGTRGSVVEPSDSGDEADFVTAVRRVLGWRVAYEGVRLGDAGDPFNPPADVEDRALVRDVYEIAFDLDTGSNPTFIPTSVVTNLTQPYRDQLDLLSPTFSEQVDFMAPSAEPDGSRIAFSSDIRIEDGTVLDVSQGSEVGFFAASDIHVIDLRALESVETIPPAPLGDLPSCDFACPPAWDRDSSSDTIYFSVGGSSPVVVLSERLARHELGGTTTSTLLGSRNVAAVSAYSNLVAGTASLLDGGATPIPIYLTDVATGEASFLIDLESFSVIACDDPSDPSICAPGDSPETFYGADPEFSPDGSRLALIVYDQPIIDPATGTNSRHHGSVYVADLGMPAAAGGSVSLIAAAGGQAKHPTWSPYGDWIAYTREDDGHLYVVSTTGGIPMRVSQAIAGRSGLTWLPSLLLP